eukprot:GHVQ01037928.1.p1 GENE.GHVQ01037928.1~~GHVQ01037928.1.p1  ORF type:complete len:567 (-),score=92.77 GHVQ01037928.1:722-2422(-)
MWTVQSADHKAQQMRIGPLKEYRHRLNITSDELLDISRDLYENQVMGFCQSGGDIPDSSRRRRLLRFRAYVGLLHSDVQDLHALYCRETYKKGVSDSLAGDGDIAAFVRKQLDELRQWLMLTPTAAGRIELSSFREFVSRGLIPQLVMEYHKMSMTREELAKKYNKDVGNDPFATRDEHNELGITASSSSFLSRCLELVKFFEKKNLFTVSNSTTTTPPGEVQDDVSKELPPLNILVPFSFIGTIDEEMRKKIFEQFLIQTFTMPHSNPNRAAYVQAVTKLGPLLGFTGALLHGQITNLGDTIYRNYLKQVLQQQNTLLPDDIDALRTVQRDFRLPGSRCETLLIEAKEKKLVESAGRLVEKGKWTVEAARKLRNIATELGLNMTEVLALDADDRASWFTSEIRDLVTTEGGVTQEVRERMKVLEDMTGVDDPDVTIQQLVYSESTSIIGGCIRDMNTNDYSEIGERLRELPLWRELAGDTWTTGRLGNEILASYEEDEIKAVLLIFASQIFEDEEERQSQVTEIAEILSIPDEAHWILYGSRARVSQVRGGRSGQDGYEEDENSE